MLQRYLRANMGISRTSLNSAMEFAQRPRRDIRNDVRIGLAWQTQSSAGGDVVWHNGGTGGYRSFLGFSADRRHGIVILANSANGVDELGFAALINDAPLAPTHKAIALDAAALDDYVGVYKFRDHFLVNMFRQGRQTFRASNRPAGAADICQRGG